MAGTGPLLCSASKYCSTSAFGGSCNVMTLNCNEVFEGYNAFTRPEAWLISSPVRGATQCEAICFWGTTVGGVSIWRDMIMEKDTNDKYRIFLWYEWRKKSVSRSRAADRVGYISWSARSRYNVSALDLVKSIHLRVLSAASRICRDKVASNVRNCGPSPAAVRPLLRFRFRPESSFSCLTGWSCLFRTRGVSFDKCTGFTFRNPLAGATWPMVRKAFRLPIWTTSGWKAFGFCDTTSVCKGRSRIVLWIITWMPNKEVIASKPPHFYNRV